jgi:hypothetical protein
MSVTTDPFYHLATMPSDMDLQTVQRLAGEVLGPATKDEKLRQHGVTVYYHMPGLADIKLQVSFSLSLPRQLLVRTDQTQWAAIGPENPATGERIVIPYTD